MGPVVICYNPLLSLQGMDIIIIIIIIIMIMIIIIIIKS